MDNLFLRAANASDKLLFRIFEVLPKIGDIQGVGVEYLIGKTITYLQGAISKRREYNICVGPESETATNPKKQKVLNIIMQIILKLIDSFGPENWPVKELEELLNLAKGVQNKALKTNITQIMTIFKDSNSPNVALKLEDKKETTPKKAGATLEEHVTLLQDGIKNLYQNSEEVEWEDKYKQLTDLLAEKNITHFLAGLDICSVFLTKALEFKRKFIEAHLLELLQPILNK